MLEVTEAHLTGQRLYGEDFSSEEIARWYRQEEEAYLDLLKDHYGIADGAGTYEYEYEVFNRFHAIDSLSNRQFSCCVALGCAAGGDVTPLAPVVERFVAIEPAEQWWRAEIGGKPAKYLKPTILGDIALEAGTADLATSFGVLHHIPNVSHVIGEVARVLQPEGLFLVREPIS
jgi:SAM-dependent methyltransferase